jgi:hypothetical protein
MFLAMQTNDISQIVMSIAACFADFEISERQPEHDQILVNRLNMPQPTVSPAQLLSDVPIRHLSEQDWSAQYRPTPLVLKIHVY